MIWMINISEILKKEDFDNQIKESILDIQNN